jgi:hypothetical protein
MKVHNLFSKSFYSYFGYKLKTKYRNLAKFNPPLLFLAPPPHFWQLKQKKNPKSITFLII